MENDRLAINLNVSKNSLSWVLAVDGETYGNSILLPLDVTRLVNDVAYKNAVWDDVVRVVKNIKGEN